ncbi:UNKNOWN [Stylonychia lemnae]|uniref:PFU domain-containing protein n=1 Tax=Stylonychia lemnae TaxID=5949 RepID=A0A077ZWU4_STYLE|nr:UNKNOWN [Stylonychia lemnae]|eukprot:CDW73762.1 UNKNOWN [Stylonychia lemnae]
MQKPVQTHILKQKSTTFPFINLPLATVDGSPDGKNKVKGMQSPTNQAQGNGIRQNYQMDSDKNNKDYQQSRRQKSQSEREKQDEMNRSRRSSKSRPNEEELPESYADLAKRVYKMAELEGWPQSKVFELLKDPMKLVKTMEHRQVRGFEKPLEPVVQRLVEDQKQREDKRRQLLDQQKKTEEENVQKSMMSSKMVVKSRTHEEFMADQIKFEQQRFEKLKQVIEKEEEESSVMYKPQLSKKSQELAHKKLGAAPVIHERLYQSIKESTIRPSDDQSFVPQINAKSKKIHRDQKIEEVLLDDALRRTQKKIQNEKQRNDLQTEENKKQTIQSKKSQQMVLNRFLQDFTACAQHHEFQEGQQFMIDYLQFENFARDLGFCNDKSASKQLLSEMWIALREILDGDNEDDLQSGHINIDDMKVFLCAVLNFNLPFMKNQQLDELEDRPKVNPKRLGQRIEGKFVVTDEEILYMTKYYVLLHASRQDYLMNNKKQSHLSRIVESQLQSDFKPATNAKSRKFIEKKNPKDEMGDLSYHDYLIQRGRQYKEKHSQLASVKDGQATDGCTFKPSILKKKLGSTQKPSEIERLNDATNKWQELYLQADKKKTKDKQDKAFDEILIDKNPEEYTFQPNAGKKKKALAERRNLSPSNSNQGRQQENLSKIQQTTQRNQSQPPAQIRGLQQQTIKTQQYSSSTTTTTTISQTVAVKQTISSKKNQYFEDQDHEHGEEPLLYVDVNLGKEKTRIALYQRSNPELVAQRFLVEHGLDSNILDNLTNLLREQLQNALTNIDEEDASDDANN